MIDGFKVYKFYIAVKLHYTTDKFNVFENKGRVKGSRDKYWSRNDRGLFEKLGRQFDTEREVIEYFVANFAAGNDCVIYDGSTAGDNLTNWSKIKQSLTKTFRDDLNKIVLHLEQNPDKVDDLYDFDGPRIPELMKLCIGNEITVQSLVILNSYREFFDNWNVQTNLIFEDECRRIVKSGGFVTFNKTSHPTLKQIFTDFQLEISEINSEGETVDITGSLI
jgi:hypothetical protein